MTDEEETARGIPHKTTQEEAARAPEATRERATREEERERSMRKRVRWVE